MTSTVPGLLLKAGILTLLNLNFLPAKQGFENILHEDMTREFREKEMQMTCKHMKGCTALLIRECELKLYEIPDGQKSKCWTTLVPYGGMGTLVPDGTTSCRGKYNSI